MNRFDPWEPVIGLEIHSELNTKSKLFSSAPNRFGDEPNTNITEVDTGMPGALPVLNKEAVRKAVQFGCAIRGEVAHQSKFDRKSYFYPDSPRNFQITQYDQPIIRGGTVIAEVEGAEKVFAINRVHLEDDAGMLKHFSTFAGIDYNRAGVPLIEIVSEPCMHSSNDAVAFAMGVKAILQYLDASDCNMEEGSLRFDVNISVRKKGEAHLRQKIEIKNLNSFSNMQKAIDSEILRQIAIYEAEPHRPSKELIRQSTFRWDPERGETVLMRRKEEADDYRYFPEPDLPLIILSERYIAEIKAALPELPLERERRYVREFGLSLDSAYFLTTDKPLADFFEKALQKSPYAKKLCNWLIVEFAGRFKASNCSIVDSGITPQHLAKLVNMIEEGTITGRMAKSIADEMVASPGKAPELIVAENPQYQPLTDHGELANIIDRVIIEQSRSVSDYRAGQERAFGFLVGQVMKLSHGKADPQMVNQLLRTRLKEDDNCNCS